MFRRITKPSHPVVIVGSAEEIRDFLCGPQQHNAHVKQHRWHLHTQGNAQRFENVMAEVRKMALDRMAKIESLRVEADEMEGL